MPLSDNQSHLMYQLSSACRPGLGQVAPLQRCEQVLPVGTPKPLDEVANLHPYNLACAWLKLFVDSFHLYIFLVIMLAGHSGRLI